MSSDISLLMIMAKSGKLLGECRRAGHVDEIDILSWSWGVSHTLSTPVPSQGSGNKVSSNEFHLTKYLDRASPVIFRACCNGEVVKEATLTMRKGGDNDDYMTVKMSDVRINAYQTSGSGGHDIPTESFSLNFLKIETTYRNQKADGALGASSTFEFTKPAR